MQLSEWVRRRRYLLPAGAAAVTVMAVVIPQAATGAAHPPLPQRTAAQLLASVEQAHIPDFSGTTVETARLGLPDLSNTSGLGAMAPTGVSGIEQLVTMLTGSHTAYLAYGGPERQRVAFLLSNLSETDIVHNGQDLWTYSSEGNTYTHHTLAAPSASSPSIEQRLPGYPAVAAELALKAINPTTAVTVDRTASVAGRPAYQLVLTPRDDRSSIGSVRIALDSATFMPLQVQIWARSGGTEPAIQIGFTSIDFQTPNPSTFDFTVPPNAVKGSGLFGAPLGSVPGPGTVISGGSQASKRPTGPAPKTPRKPLSVIGSGWTSVIELQPQSQPQLQPTPRSDRGSGRKGSAGAPAPSMSNPLGGVIGEFGTPDGHGNLIMQTTLLTGLVTGDGRIYFGAVTPSYLEQVAARSGR